MYLHMYIFNCLSGNDLANWPTLWILKATQVVRIKLILTACVAFKIQFEIDKKSS